MPGALRQGYSEWRDALCRRRHRALLLITGEADDCRRKAAELLADWPDLTAESGVWLGQHGTAALRQMDIGRARELTGRQLRVAVIDAYCGLSADALGAVGGCIEGGGVLILLAPPRSDWGRFQDPAYRRRCPWPYTTADYHSRFWRHLERTLTGEAVVEIPAAASASMISRILASQAMAPEGMVSEAMLSRSGISRTEASGSGASESMAAPPRQAGPAVSPQAAANADESPANADQTAAVAAIQRLARGRAGRPLVLIAHRGRGKSAALGIAAAQLLSSHRLSEVIVTAARRSALATLFQHAGRVWPNAQRHGDTLSDGHASLRFVAPDQIPEQPQLLLVDEAAALPAIVLRRLLRAPRIVFASTVHGYEGSGRGFDLRFTRLLDQLAPRWRRLGLSQPLRWAADDPLEALLFRALMLDAEPARPLPPRPGMDDDPRCTILDRDRLVADEPRLRSLFGLLVAAHYRTTPDDLRELLDAPQIRVWAVTQGRDGPIVGAALVADEGGLPSDLAQAVRNGQRRPRGHLLAQSLAFHGGWRAAAEQRGARIVRIAIHPDLRRRGLGLDLLAAIARDEARRGTAWLGSSFALDAELIGFWRRAGFAAVRLGVRREAASGERSLQVVRSLSPAAERLAGAPDNTTGMAEAESNVAATAGPAEGAAPTAEETAPENWIDSARRHFLRSLPLLLADAWRDLDVEIVQALFAGQADAYPPPGRDARDDLRAFIAGRPLPTCLPAWTVLARHLLALSSPWYASPWYASPSYTPPCYSPEQYAALVLRLVQLQTDVEVVRRLQLQGIDALRQELVAIAQRWLDSEY